MGIYNSVFLMKMLNLSIMNFDKVKKIVNTFNETDATSIQNAQELFKDNTIKNKCAIMLSNIHNRNRAPILEKVSLVS